VDTVRLPSGVVLASRSRTVWYKNWPGCSAPADTWNPRLCAVVSTGVEADVTGTCAAAVAPDRPNANAARQRRRRTALSARTTDAVQRVEPDQHVARLRAIGRPEHAGRVQLVDDSRRTPVPDLEPALQQRRRPLLILHHHFGGFAEQLVAIVSAAVAVVPRRSTLERLFRANRLEHVGLHRFFDGEPLRCARRTLGLARQLIPAHQPLGFVARQIRALQPRRLRLARWDEQHVAVAEQHLGAGAVDDRSTVDL